MDKAQWMGWVLDSEAAEVEAQNYRDANPKLYENSATGEDGGEAFDYSKIDPETGEPYDPDDVEDDDDEGSDDTYDGEVDPTTGKPWDDILDQGPEQ